MGNRFTIPTEPYVKRLLDDLIEAQRTLHTKIKLALIMPSKATTDSIVAIGDMVDVLDKWLGEKCGKWLSSR